MKRIFMISGVIVGLFFVLALAAFCKTRDWEKKISDISMIYPFYGYEAVDNKYNTSVFARFFVIDSGEIADAQNHICFLYGDSVEPLRAEVSNTEIIKEKRFLSGYKVIQFDVVCDFSGDSLAEYNGISINGHKMNFGSLIIDPIDSFRVENLSLGNASSESYKNGYFISVNAEKLEKDVTVKSISYVYDGKTCELLNEEISVKAGERFENKYPFSEQYECVFAITPKIVYEYDGGIYSSVPYGVTFMKESTTVANISEKDIREYIKEKDN